MLLEPPQSISASKMSIKKSHLPAPRLKPVSNCKVAYQIFATAKTLQKTVYTGKKKESLVKSWEKL